MRLSILIIVTTDTQSETFYNSSGNNKLKLRLFIPILAITDINLVYKFWNWYKKLNTFYTSWFYTGFYT